MNSHEFEKSWENLRRQKAEEEANRSVQESRRLRNEAEEIQQKLSECRQRIFSAISQNKNYVILPLEVPHSFITEMKQNEIWLHGPRGQRWDREEDRGGGMGFGPAIGAKITSASYDISLRRPPSPTL